MPADYHSLYSPIDRKHVFSRRELVERAESPFIVSTGGGLVPFTDVSFDGHICNNAYDMSVTDQNPIVVGHRQNLAS